MVLTRAVQGLGTVTSRYPPTTDRETRNERRTPGVHTPDTSSSVNTDDLRSYVADTSTPPVSETARAWCPPDELGDLPAGTLTLVAYRRSPVVADVAAG